MNQQLRKTRFCNYLVFPSLLVLLGLKYLPFWTGYVLPYHDAMDMYQGFHYFYSGVLVNHEFPLWTPHANYGLHSSFLFEGCFTPCSYLVGLVGVICKVRNTMLLFSLAMFLQEFIYATGVFLLARKCFRHASTVLFVAAIVILAGFDLREPFFHINMLYAAPLVFYFVYLYFEEAKLTYLVIAMNVFALGNPGAVYTAVVQTLSLAMIVAMSIAAHANSWRRYLKYTRRDITISLLLLLLFSIFIVAYYRVIADTQRFVFIHSPGRAQGSASVTLETFLSWGAFPTKWDLVELIKPTLFFRNSDYTIYMGPCCVLLFLYSLFVFFRNPNRYIYLSCLACACLIVLFSLGRRTPVAEFLYNYYPIMKYYRHVGYSISYVTLFAPLLAGFGCDALISNLFRTSRTYLAYGITALVLGATIYPLLNYQKKIAESVHLNVVAPLKGACLSYPGLFLAHKETFPSRRTVKPETERARKGACITTWPNSEIYPTAFVFLGWDSCQFDYRWNAANQLVAELMRMMNVNVDSRKLDSPGLMKMVDCGSDKLHLLADTLRAYTPSQEASLIRADDLNPTPVVFVDRVDPLVELPPENNGGVGHAINVTRFTDNRLEARVVLDGERPAWLYYADAWHPNWKATVNGAPSHIYKANHAFKAVIVTPGINEIVFEFDSPDVWGAVCTMILCGVGWLFVGAAFLARTLFRPEAENYSFAA